MARKLLIVDDIATNRILLKVKLAAACYATVQAADGASALRMVAQEKPDLVLLDLCLPDMTGLAVLNRLRADPATRDLPVIVISAQTDAQARIAALRAGADDVVPKPFDDQILLARVRGLLRAREQAQELRGDDPAARAMAEPGATFDRPGIIALIARNGDEARDWQARLAPLLPDRMIILTREAALAAASSGAAPDIYVIAAALHGPGDGMRLMSDLRSRPGSHHAAICLVIDTKNRDAAAMGLDLGADDLLPTDATAGEVALRLRAQMRRKQTADQNRARLHDQLRLATHDPLTGLHNRHYAIPQLARIAERARKAGSAYAVLLLDIDRFKSVNDLHGHLVGDHVLAEVALRLRRELRAVDLIARIGGEEFLVVLPDATPEGAQQVAERLCVAVRAAPIALPRGGTLSVTISIGLALERPGGIKTLPPGKVPSGNFATPAEAGRSAVERADRALLCAKARGRDQVTTSSCAA
jgi:two-component system cell cycle response regulator